jgi:protease-4
MMPLSPSSQRDNLVPRRAPTINSAAVVGEVLVNSGRWLRNVRAGMSPGAEFVHLEVAGNLPERRRRQEGWRTWVQRRFNPPRESLELWRERLGVLAGDPRLRGVVITIGEVQAGRAALESLRRIFLDFQSSGKRLIAFLVSANLSTYYLASAAEVIFAPESLELALHGLRTESTFLRAALDQLGVQPQFHHIAEYKSAANRFLHSTMPISQREMLTSLLESIFEDMVAGIASTRRLSGEEVRRAIDQGMLSAAAAQERGLLDGIAFADELPLRLGHNGRAAVIQPWEQARRAIVQPYRWRSLERQAIGVVQLLGTIVPGESRDLPLPLPLLGRRLAGHESITQALRRAESSARIKALVLHIDSPGGSAIASDLIWREVSRIQRHKPVVVFMGNVAASGGYYVACGARHIVASATTLTGSIGVIAGKVNLLGLLEKVGIRRELVSLGATASMPSTFASYSDAEWALLQTWMEEVYQRFKARVAAGRGRSIEAIEEIARGRVWTGRQALGIGLIDELGDFESAVRQAKELAGLPLQADTPVLTMRSTTARGWPSAAPASWEDLWLSAERLWTERALVLMPPGTEVY